MLLRFFLLALAAALIVSCSSNESRQIATPQPEAVQEAAQAAEQQNPALEQAEQVEQIAPSSPSQQADQPAAQKSPTNQAEPQPAQQEQPSALPQPPPDAVPAPKFDLEAAIAYVNHLAGELGPRTSGTEEEVAAARYLALTFEQFGYEVEIQEFSYTARGGVSRIDLDDGFSTIAFRFAESADQGVSGELVDVPGFGESSDFAAAEVNGRIAIVDRGLIEFRDKAANAESAGAIAMVIVNRLDSDSLGGTFGTYTSQIPVLQITSEAGEGLRSRLAERATIPDALPTTGQSQNVIARKPDGICRVVVGGHYDTVPEVSGANDNASGTALTLAFAQAWADHPAAADICFVGFGAEELGLHGSMFFVRQFRASAELDQLTAMLNLDAIGDGRTPYRIISSSELKSIGEAVADDLQVLAGSGSLPMMFGSDHASFASAGVPVVFLFPPGAILHTPADNLENFNREVFSDIASLNHGILSCLLLRAGSPVIPTAACVVE